MTEVPESHAVSKRRWYQFRLSTLFCLMTLASLVIIGRVEFLRRMALFHEQRVDDLLTEIQTEQPYSRAEIREAVRVYEDEHLSATGADCSFVVFPIGGKREIYVEFTEKFRQREHHRKLAALYRSATLEPWKTFVEPPMAKPVAPVPVVPPASPPRIPIGDY